MVVAVGVEAELVVADGQAARDLVHVVVHQLAVGIVVVVVVVVVTFIGKTLWPESRWVRKQRWPSFEGWKIS